MPRRPASTSKSIPTEDVLDAGELVVDPHGRVRQAGASAADTAFIAATRARCERSLYAFAKGILNYHFLTAALHKPVADWLQKFPPFRKLLLMPRGHGKTQLVPRSIPLHAWIQPTATNLYLPGVPGTHTRILLAGETETMAKGNIRVVRSHLESNDLLRGLWPHVVWENPRRDAKVWNDTEIIIPRDTEFAEASLQACGVGAAITGKHPNFLLKDDITTEAAANSDVIMQTAIDWHINTRALMSSPSTDPEITTATYWAVHDLPHEIEKDPSVAVNKRFRAIVTPDGTPIWPEHVTRAEVEQLSREYGPRFFLLYMNSVSDSALVDFDRADLRFFALHGNALDYTDDPRDTLWPAESATAPDPLDQVDLPRPPPPEIVLPHGGIPARSHRAALIWKSRHAQRFAR